MIQSVRLRAFKKVRDVQIDIEDINVIVGGNNSGKSSVLQGVHFFVIAAIASREAQRQTFPQDELLFCPARDFSDLGYGSGFTNQTNWGYLNIEGSAEDPDDPPPSYEIAVYRGRNVGNVGCLRAGDGALGNQVTDPNRLFSAYVPGLAGIPREEQFRSEGVIRRGVASGDANLYLRNVLWLIRESGSLQDLRTWLRTLFPRFEIDIQFDPRKDATISAGVSTSRYASPRPLELAGTGLLQAIQIFAYVTLFGPKLLLLDEPDAPLHPDNQNLLARTLQSVVETTDTKILIATHSRHLLDALADSARLIWLKDGEVTEQGADVTRVSLLMDLGALDRFDRLGAGDIDLLVLSEDTDTSPLELLLWENGAQEQWTQVISYKSASRFESALDLAAFVQRAAPATRIIIHRDSDFMIEAEVDRLRRKAETVGAHLFATRGSDIELYFVDPSHCADVLGEEVEIVRAWIDELATAHHNSLVQDFVRKRDELIPVLYRGRRDQAPSARDLLIDAIPLAPEQRTGKAMLRLINRSMHERFGQAPHLAVRSAALADVGLAQLIHEEAEA